MPQLFAVVSRHGATILRFFGSIATDQGSPASDLGLLVNHGAEQSRLGLISLCQDFEDLLGCGADVTEAETLHPLIGELILKHALALSTKLWKRSITKYNSQVNA